MRNQTDVTYQVGDGTAQGYLAMPEGGEGQGVLVLHPWWGLNDTIRAVCTRLADAGFVAFAPDLYHGEIATTIAEAETLSTALYNNLSQAIVEIAGATSYLRTLTNNTLAVIGFSMGANYGLGLASADPEDIRSVVLFYGTGGGDWSTSQASFLGHFAEDDPYEPLEGVDELEASIRSAGRPVTFYRYPGTGHWFFEPDRVDAYNEEAANLAWERTLAFLRT